MSEAPWPFVFGRLQVGPMPHGTRVAHVCKHLLDLSEAWWEVCTLSRREIEAHQAAVVASDRGPVEAARLAHLARDLYTSDYEPVFRSVLERFATREAQVDADPLPEQEAFALFDQQWLVKVIARKSPAAPEGHPWPVLTAYRMVGFAGTKERHRRRQSVRTARRAASLGQRLIGSTGEQP